MPVKQGIQKVGGNCYAYQPAHLCPFMVAPAAVRVKRPKRITQNKMVRVLVRTAPGRNATH